MADPGTPDAVALARLEIALMWRSKPDPVNSARVARNVDEMALGLIAADEAHYALTARITDLEAALGSIAESLAGDVTGLQNIARAALAAYEATEGADGG